MIRYNIFQNKKNTKIIIKELYIQAPNGEVLCFLKKNYQLTIEKEEFLIFTEQLHARKTLSNRFGILEQNFLTNLKKSKDFLWAKKGYEKKKTKQISKTQQQSVEMLERWVSVLNFCDYLQNSLNFTNY